MLSTFVIDYKKDYHGSVEIILIGFLLLLTCLKFNENTSQKMCYDFYSRDIVQ